MKINEEKREVFFAQQNKVSFIFNGNKIFDANKKSLSYHGPMKLNFTTLVG